MCQLLSKKLDNLKKILSSYHSAIIAFSGGVDSTLLARVAKDVCSNVKLVTISFSAIPEFEIADSVKLARILDLKHEIIKTNELEIPGFTKNDPERCYYCKKYLFTALKKHALNNKFDIVFDGTNADDIADYRPGRKALKELGIVSPLKIANLSKEEIRFVSKEYGLSTDSKPSYACLASRFPYGEKLTESKLKRVGSAEEEIRKLGFTQFRVRSHNNLARIEFIPEEMDEAWRKRKLIEQKCRQKGFDYVALDTTGYRTGAMNESLSEKDIQKFRKYA
jgi:pyridinium-3,5-biscarboxylic acid mononucleotide sulfurtransferase